jgi:hypothetical protein
MIATPLMHPRKDGNQFGHKLLLGSFISPFLPVNSLRELAISTPDLKPRAMP